MVIPKKKPTLYSAKPFPLLVYEAIECLKMKPERINILSSPVTKQHTAFALQYKDTAQKTGRR
jgi:hypothetical protein